MPFPFVGPATTVLVALSLKEYFTPGNEAPIEMVAVWPWQIVFCVVVKVSLLMAGMHCALTWCVNNVIELMSSSFFIILVLVQTYRIKMQDIFILQQRTIGFRNGQKKNPLFR